MVDYCLDTYALAEIEKGNNNFDMFKKVDFVIPSPVLAEFYFVLLRERDKKTADFWIKNLRNLSIDVSFEIWEKACLFRIKNKGLSYFDCIGYVFAKEKGFKFVTGDKEFKNKKDVLYLK